MNTPTQERAAFEAWVRSHQLGSPPITNVFEMFPACWEGWQARAALSSALPQPDSGHQAERLTEEHVEDCIDSANRKYNHYCSSGVRGQQITTRDDWKHWLAREIEDAVHQAERSADTPAPEPRNDSGHLT